MGEEIKKFWDNAEIMAVKSWYDSAKGFDQIAWENNFLAEKLFKILNSIKDYKVTRCSIGKWLRNELRRMESKQIPSEMPQKFQLAA